MTTELIKRLNIPIRKGKSSNFYDYIRYLVVLSRRRRYKKQMALDSKYQSVLQCKICLKETHNLPLDSRTAST